MASFRVIMALSDYFYPFMTMKYPVKLLYVYLTLLCATLRTYRKGEVLKLVKELDSSDKLMV